MHTCFIAFVFYLCNGLRCQIDQGYSTKTDVYIFGINICIINTLKHARLLSSFHLMTDHYIIIYLHQNMHLFLVLLFFDVFLIYYIIAYYLSNIFKFLEDLSMLFRMEMETELVNISSNVLIIVFCF